MRHEAWFRGRKAQSQVEREAERLANFFRDRQPAPQIEVTKRGNLALALVGFWMVLQPLEDGSYKLLQAGGKFDLHPEDVENYELQVGGSVPLANIARFVHDYTEAQEWERL